MKQHPHARPQWVPSSAIPTCATEGCNKKCHNKGPNRQTGKRSYRTVCATCHARIMEENRIEREALGMTVREHQAFQRARDAIKKRKSENNLLSMLENQ